LPNVQACPHALDQPTASFRVSEGTATSSQPRGKHYVHVTVTDSAERDRRTPCDVPVRQPGTLLTLFAVALISATTASAGTPIPLGSAPLAVKHVCSERARLHKFAVLCPTSYPHARDSSVTVSGLVLQGPSFYWASFNDSSGFPTADGGHLILGGQRKPFSLAGLRGQTWPRPGQPHPVLQLPLPRLLTTPMQGGKTYIAQRPPRILMHAQVNGAAALILTAAPYPGGGISSGHIIVLWNWHAHGYLISLHFAPYAVATRIATALIIARSSRPTAPS
jgi:hypothetical protein